MHEKVVLVKCSFLLPLHMCFSLYGSFDVLVCVCCIVCVEFRLALPCIKLFDCSCSLRKQKTTLAYYILLEKILSGMLAVA